MPTRAPRICACGNRIAPGKACTCQRSRRANSSERGYGTEWQKARLAFLALHPACTRCGGPATVVHHTVPHRGDQRLFWMRSSWEAVCKPCHDGPIQSEEKGGRGSRLSGAPSLTGGAHKKISSRIEVLKS